MPTNKKYDTQHLKRGKNMKVASVETLSCDAGWRNYHFVKLVTDSGIKGRIEYDEGFGSTVVGNVISKKSDREVGPAKTANASCPTK